MNDDFVMLTTLGESYGVPARVVGGWLKECGLRGPDGRPTAEAQSQGLVRERALEQGGTFWLWHKVKTCEILDGLHSRPGGLLGVEQHDGFVLIRAERR